MKKIIGEIYEAYLQEVYQRLLSENEDLGREFMAEVCELEKQRIHLSSMKKPITKLEHLNIRIMDDLKNGWDSLGFKSPALVRAYGRIYIFLLPLVSEYEKKLIGLSIFKNTGGDDSGI